MSKDDNLVKFITGVRFSYQNLKQLNAITFLFDPSWEAGIGSVATLPMSIFYVKNISEIYDTNISQKQLIFNGGSAISSQSVTNAQTSIIADNIVLNPKTYKLQIIVPFAASSDLQINALNAYQQNSVYAFIANQGSDYSKYVGALGGLKFTSEIFKLIWGLAEDFFSARTIAKGGTGYWREVFLNITDTPSYNKDSLEAMWRNRSILKMKMWNDWRYKYVVIKNLELSKEGVSNNICEGTLTVQEMPIMTVRPRAGNLKRNWVGNPIIQSIGKVIKKLINSMESEEY